MTEMEKEGGEERGKLCLLGMEKDIELWFRCSLGVIHRISVANVLHMTSPFAYMGK